MKSALLVLFAIIFLVSCNARIDSNTYSEFQQKGNEISKKAQATLLSNVGTAMQKGGPVHAVAFCNLEASGIVEQLNQEFDCTITRVSDKNRNPNAALSSAQEKELWESFKTGTLNDTIVQENKSLIFYKPIKIAMPACLKCHGNPQTDINEATNNKLQELYPEDLATGYSLNDFRGLWKIEFVRE